MSIKVKKIKNGKKKCHVEQEIQPLHPFSINSARSSPRMCLLNSLSVLADLSSDDSFAHNLGPKYRSECGSECDT